MFAHVSIYLQSEMDWAGRRSWWTVGGCVAPARPPGTGPPVDPGPDLEMTWSDEEERHWDQKHDGYKSSYIKRGKEGERRREGKRGDGGRKREEGRKREGEIGTKGGRER